MTAPYQPPVACGDKVGSLTGLARHRKAKEAPCRSCLDAHNRAQKARYWAKKKRSASLRLPVPEV